MKPQNKIRKISFWLFALVLSITGISVSAQSGYTDPIEAKRAIGNAPLNTIVRIDYTDWYVVKRYPTTGTPTATMLVAVRPTNNGPTWFTATLENPSNIYEGSGLQTKVTQFYTGSANLNVIKQIAIQPEIGNVNDNRSTTFLTWPKASMSPAGNQTKDILFALTYQDVHAWDNVAHSVFTSSYHFRWWTRTGENTYDRAYEVNIPGGTLTPGSHVSSSIDIVVGVWVNSNILKYTISGKLEGASNVANQTITYQIAGVNKTVQTDANGNYLISDIEESSVVLITPPDLQGYSVNPETILTAPMSANLINQDFTYTGLIAPVSINPIDGATLCFGDSISLSVTNTDSYTDPSYKWYTIANNATTLVGTNSSYIAKTSGDYYVEVTDEGFSVNSDTVTIIIKPAITLNPPTTIPAICSGNVAAYTATSATADVTFSWSRTAIPGITPATNSASGNTIHEVLVNSTENPITVVYTFTLTADGCATTQEVTIVVNAAPAANINVPRDLCIDDTMFVKNAAPGGKWHTLNPDIADIDTITGEVTGLNAGIATITYAVMSYGCLSAATAQVTVLPNAGNVQISIEKTSPVCANDEVIITASAKDVDNPVFYWYRSVEDTEPFFTGNPYRSSDITEDTVFYVRVSGERACVEK
jgi:hypothetical protein